VLSVGRVAGHGLFTETDMDQLTVFAGHAGLALELARARDARDTLARIEDHDRIAADLHDQVIQELFATGMGLQGLIHLLPSDEHRRRVLGYVDAIDGTIHRIRTTIFQLQDARHPSHDSLHETVLGVLRDHTVTLGFDPAIEFAGPTETIPAELVGDVVAVVREALTNIACHAHATLATVRIGLAGDLVDVEVTDDGDGFGTATPSGGLADLGRLAVAREGTLELSAPARGGTAVRWTARVSSLAL
jgi:signal transduction histidine kinase